MLLSMINKKKNFMIVRWPSENYLSKKKTKCYQVNFRCPVQNSA